MDFETMLGFHGDVGEDVWFILCVYNSCFLCSQLSLPFHKIDELTSKSKNKQYLHTERVNVKFCKQRVATTCVMGRVG